jgi:hypothetical protein
LMGVYGTMHTVTRKLSVSLCVFHCAAERVGLADHKNACSTVNDIVIVGFSC